MTVRNPFLTRVNGRDKGFHGRQAEESLAKRTRGTQQPGSGAVAGAKGDVTVATSEISLLIENKTTKGVSLTLQKDWLLSVYQYALEQNRIPALAFQFTNDAGKSEKRERWVALPEHIAAQFLDLPDYKS